LIFLQRMFLIFYKICQRKREKSNDKITYSIKNVSKANYIVFDYTKDNLTTDTRVLECLSRKISGMFYQYVLINLWHTFNVLTNTSLKDDMQMEEESCSGKQVFLIKSINRKSFEMLKLETRIMINTNKHSNSLYKFF